MKLILQIALGVFLGSFLSQAAIDYWRDQKMAALARAEQEQKVRQEDAMRNARNLILRQFKLKQEADAERSKQEVSNSTPKPDGAALGLPPGMPVPSKQP